MPHDRDATARTARQLIQAAGPPDESNATVYRVVEEFAADHGLTPRDVAGISPNDSTTTYSTESRR